MALFTVETASVMGKRSAELRKQRELEQAERLANPTILPLATVSETDQNRQAKLTRTCAQIDSLDALLDKCTDAKEWDCLTRAKERLFRAWVHLAGIPGPGQRKPAPERSRPARPSSSLIEE